MCKNIAGYAGKHRKIKKAEKKYNKRKIKKTNATISKGFILIKF
jgi:hypothetical protein